MVIETWRDRLWATVGVMGSVVCFSLPAVAQVVPDATLGNEQSTVTHQTVRGVDSDRIDGGARRGQNLFHSFQQFDVPEGRGAYFTDPDGVTNIFSRVTGVDRSEIMGRLGVLGDANLFFMNPNGILFGPNSSLDVNGSFVGTTANAIQFGAQGVFSATTPELPSDLLTIDPSALLFSSQLAAPSSISVQGDGQGLRSSNIPIDTQTGLRIPGDRTLALLGGDLLLDRATLKTAGGRIELGSVGSSSTVGLLPVSTGWSFNYDHVQNFRDIRLDDQSAVDASGLGGGNIRVQGRQITLTGGSQIEASTLGTEPGGNLEVTASDSINIESVATDNFYTGVYDQVYAGASGRGGNLEIRTDRLNLTGNFAIVTTSTYGSGRGGDLTIHANDVEVTGANEIGSLTLIEADAAGQEGGQGGNLTIDTRQLRIRRAQVSASTHGIGNAGNMTVHATNSVELSGDIPGNESESGYPGGLFSIVNPEAEGQGGNLTIETDHLSISDGSKAQAISFGNGNSGNVNITAHEVNVFETAQPNYYSTGIFVGAGFDPQHNLELTQGGQGNLVLNADRVSIRGGEISAATRGQGNAGNVLIHAHNLVEVIDATAATGWDSSINAAVFRGATGRGGNVTIETNRLRVQGGLIFASTNGQGNAGNLTIRALDSISLVGEIPGIDGGSGSAGGLFARVRPGASGHGGDISIDTNLLNIQDGSQIQVATLGNGRAGRLSIRSDQINVRETRRSNSFPTGIFAGVETESQAENPPIGNGGDLTIRTDRLSIRGGAISANTAGKGNAGQLNIYADDLVEVVGRPEVGSTSFLGADVSAGATGRGGQVTIETGQLRIREGGRVSVRTSGAGDAGTLRVNANSIEVDGRFGNEHAPSQLSAAVARPSTGRGGDLILHANDVQVSNGGQISARTDGQRRAGDISIRANDSISLANGAISTAATQQSSGRGGDITIQTGSLDAKDQAQITAQNQGIGRAGNITINANDHIHLENSNIQTIATQSTGGRIQVNQNVNHAGNIVLENGDILTRSRNDAGDIVLRASGIVALGDSDIITRSEDGQGGDIALDAFFSQTVPPDSQSPFDHDDRVDVNAEGEIASGVVTSPDTSFIQNSLTDLPDAAIDTEALISSSCVVRRAGQSGTFVIVGAGGLPERPGSTTQSYFPSGEVRSVPAVSSNLREGWHIGDPILEPQGVYQLEDGNLVLSRECS